jgi:hypothetical protein
MDLYTGSVYKRELPSIAIPMLYLHLRPFRRDIVPVVGEVWGRSNLDEFKTIKSMSREHFAILEFGVLESGEGFVRILHKGTSDGVLIRRGSTEREAVKEGTEITLRLGDRYHFIWDWGQIFLEAVEDEDANKESDEEEDDDEDDDDREFVDDNESVEQNRKSLVSVARELTESIFRRLDPEGDRKNPVPSVKKPKGVRKIHQILGVRKFRRIPILEKLKKQKLRVTAVSSGADAAATHKVLDAKLIEEAKMGVPKDAFDKDSILQALVDQKWAEMQVRKHSDA